MSEKREVNGAERLDGHTAAENEYSTLLRLLDVSVSKHLLDQSFTCIWANSNFYELIGYAKAEFETRFHNCPKEYFHNNPEGWKLLEKSVRDALSKGEKGNTVYLPLVRPDGAPFWDKLQARQEKAAAADASERLRDVFDVDMNHLASFDVYSVLTP